MKQLYYLAGLPRSGSTLLSSILYQNPQIHTEGHSALCSTMWDTLQSLERSPHIAATGRQKTIEVIMTMLPKTYYMNIQRNIVIDKSFTWTLPGNIDMIKRYVTPNPKFIVMDRPVDEIVNSFVKLMERNNTNGIFEDGVGRLEGALEERRKKAVLIEGGSLDAEIRAFNYAKNHPNQTMFHYVQYKNLIEKTDETIKNIYTFLGLPHFEHNLHNIINHHEEDDSVWGLPGMHITRPVISYR